MGDKPSDGAVIERAFSLANIAMHTVALQCRRLKSSEPEDSEFVFRWWADLQFLIVALTRLRAAARTIRKAKGIRIDGAIKAFDVGIPSLKEMRDVAEHVDEYAVASGKQFHVKISRKELAVAKWDGSTFFWLTGALNVGEALGAAQALYKALQLEKNRFKTELTGK